MQLCIKIISILLLFNLLLSENLINKKLNYKIKFRGIDAGSAYLKIEADTLLNENILRLNSKLKTNKFLDLFYKIRDEINSWIDKEGFYLVKQEKNIRKSNLMQY